jgi:hypothetical protein
MIDPPTYISFLQGIESSSSVQDKLSNPWDSNPKEAQDRIVLPNLSTKKGSGKTMNIPSKDIK